MRVSLCLALCGGLAVGSSALAQSIPPAADPARIGTDRGTLPMRELRELESPSAPATVRPDTPAGAESQKFVLNEVTISGMTAYALHEVRPLYAKLLGQEISVATLFELIAAIQNKYLQDGYTLIRVTLPPQEIADGIVRIDVAEGYVGEVVMDPSMPDDFVTKDAVRRILAMRPLNTVTLERLLLIMNALPRLGVGAVLAQAEHPDPKNPNAVRLILRNTPVEETVAGIGIDNHGSVFAGPWQASGYARAFGIGVPHSVLEVSGLTSVPVREQKFFAIDYSAPVFGASGAKLSVGTAYARTEPGANLDPLDVQGKSKFLSVNLAYPLIFQRAEELKLDAGFDIRNADTDFLGDLLYDDRLRVARFGVNYTASDAYAGITLMDLRYARGLDIFGARETGSDFLSRRDGHSDFNKFNAIVGRLQALPRNFEVYALISAQYSLEPLLSAEEFGFGGGRIGRGYNPSELAGDSGIAGTLELRHNSGALPGLEEVRAQPYLFWDIGKVWNIDDGDTTDASAASGGLGTRFATESGWDLDVNLAFPMTRSAQNAPKYASEYGPRVLFELRRAF